ncbi:hypothetical protein HPB48_020382 [Haemaphysalis longicornis]|uniref:THAP-type domain-containing protein n=1 Tax=Haemaphysalis longicornis TaxID=44386 RepID=A0A9J6FXW5_HAELO|nr:hypothetical protein HPB48_020382 [Haemaphysalis longicornis]
MPFCCAYQCNNRSEKVFSLFTIPSGKRDIQRKKQWLHNIGRKDFAPTRRTSLCEQALLDRIAQLERLQENTRRKLVTARKRYLKSENEKSCLKKRIRGPFNEDQMRSMERLSTQVRLRLTCGSRGYNFLREYGYPIPVERTLQRHIQHVKFRPGLLTDIVDPLKMKIFNAHSQNYSAHEVVQKHKLPTARVDLAHVKKLVEEDDKSELKIAPHLNSSCVDPKHYDKMKVKFAFSLFHNDTAAGLRLLVDSGKLEKEALTTAWFISKVFRWFRLMTSRTTKLAFSHAVEASYDDDVKCLKDTLDLFSKLEPQRKHPGNQCKLGSL